MKQLVAKQILNRDIGTKKWKTMIIKDRRQIKKIKPSNSMIALMDVEKFLDSLPEEPIFDLVITSPPYDVGKEYEKKIPLKEYLAWQKRVLEKIALRVKDTGSICYEVGTYVNDGEITPLDYEFYQIFKELGFKLRNRIVWHFGHGLHSKNRFSGRHEVILWYSKTDNYTFNLDDVRVPAKYPGKKHYTGPNKGKLSGNPLGKNPEDVWEIPNVKSNHVEKTIHPCQFPVALAERLILALSNENELVFDPFCGVATTGIAANLHDRVFWGCEIEKKYVEIGEQRLIDLKNGVLRYREDKPVYDPKMSNLSKLPQEWRNKKDED